MFNSPFSYHSHKIANNGQCFSIIFIGLYYGRLYTISIDSVLADCWIETVCGIYYLSSTWKQFKPIRCVVWL